MPFTDIPHPDTQKRSQRGAAFIVMLVVMVLGVATLLVASLSSSSLKIERDARTADALAQAKEALIGKSASYNDYPGSLPCPDIDNDGDADSIGGTPNECPQYIGRLPWKTLGIPDLRDASGERLWYTLSRNVRRYPTVPPLNSDTTGTLNLTGSYSDSNLMAIVFAPGTPVSTQARGDINTACTPPSSSDPKCMPANYLEGTNDNPSPGAAPNVGYQSSDPTIEFNDQLIAITHDQLFTTVEKRVAREIRALLATYHTTWSAYPYAATFMNPTTAYTTSSPVYRPFIGDNGINSGLLPMGAVWTGVPTYTVTGGGSVDVDYCDLSNGYNSLANARWRCYINSITGTPTIHITGTLKGLRLWRPHNLSDSTQARVRRSGISYPAASISGMNATVSYTPKANGDVDVTFTGVLSHSDIERIELRDVIVDSSIDPVDASFAWFTRNRWHHVMYYSVSPGYVPGGGNSCTPLGAPSCLTVNGPSASNDNHAVLIMTGRTIAGGHPSGNLNDYLEGQNQTPADYVFEKQTLSASFNDQIVIISP